MNQHSNTILIITILITPLLILTGCIENNSSTKTIHIYYNDTTTYPTIQAAINYATTGDQLIIHNGTYYEHLTINKTISITGENKHTTIIDGNKINTTMNITAYHVTITNLTIQNSGTNDYPTRDSAIKILANNCIITNTIIQNGQYGIFSNQDSTNNIIKNNLFQNNSIAIRFKGIYQNEISYNQFTKNEIGVYLCCGSVLNTVYANTFINNTLHAQDTEINNWNKKTIGNYWDDYLIKYPNAAMINSYWNTSYAIKGGNNLDEFPLIQPLTSLPEN